MSIQMASVEMSMAGTERGQKEQVLPPTEEDSSPLLNDTSAPLDFTELTPCQFGISVQSFTPASSSNSKDKSRLAQIKARRRSTIGVRGSPETNSLIRFMAQQRMKTPSKLQTPEPVRSSPVLPRVSSTLRQKMASFQSLMDVDEHEVCDPMPRQDSNTGGCIKTRDYLSDENSHYGEKENHPPMTTPSKRRRLGPRGGCEVEIREARAPVLHFSLKEQEEEEEPTTQGPLLSSNTVEEAQAVLISPALHADLERHVCSPAKNQQDGVFELQSLCQPPPDDPAAAAPAQPASPFFISSLPSLSEMKPTGEDDSNSRSMVKEKKKKVRFGGPLSPEFFDKNLPPSTPLQKGGTPARAPTPGGSFQLRSLLKTPQRGESQTPQAQPDLNGPAGFGASPTLAMPRNRRMQSVGEDREENGGEGLIVFSSMEEIDSAATSNTDWDAQPLNLNSAFLEESLQQEIQTDPETKAIETSQLDALDEPTSLPEKEQQGTGVTASTHSRNLRKKQLGAERESSGEASVRPRGRKRKQPEENEPVKRSTRSAAKSASGRMKRTSRATRQWNRDVDRSLYGSREYASKNPTLSPITERLSFINQSAAQQTPSTSCSAPNHDTHVTSETASDTQTISDPTETIALENPSEGSITSLSTRKKKSTGKEGRLSGLRGRGLKRQTVSVVIDALLSEETLDLVAGKTEEQCEAQTTADLETSRETLLHCAAPEQVDTEHGAQISADVNCTVGKFECHSHLDAPTSDCPPSGEESSNTMSLPAEPAAQRQDKRGRRSTVKKSEEQRSQAEEHQTSHEAEEKGQVDQAASQQESHSRASSDSQGEGGLVDLPLAPWQADFNFEDVFKPVATRGQRSVRRSLRNQSNVEQSSSSSSSSAGLAWLAWTSPESITAVRRKTRGRRLSAAPPVQPLLPEETQDNTS